MSPRTRSSYRSSTRRPTSRGGLPTHSRRPAASCYRRNPKRKVVPPKPKVKPGPRYAGDHFRQQRTRFTVAYLATKVESLRDEAKRDGISSFGILRKTVNEYNTKAKQEGSTDIPITENQVSQKISDLKAIAAKITRDEEEIAEDTDLDAPLPPPLQAPAAATRGRKDPVKERLKKDVTISIRNNITVAFKDYVKSLEEGLTEEPQRTQLEAFEEIKQTIVSKYRASFDFATDGNFTINAARKRIANNKLQVDGRGQKSPVEKAEPYVVQLCTRASKCNHSLTRHEVIDLMNGLIENTEIERDLVNWKTHHCKNSKIVPFNKVGRSWLKSFLNRFPEIRVANGTNRNRNREEWCTYHNVRDMYDILYGYWLENDSKYLERIEGEWQDARGKAVAIDDPTRLGRKVHYKWLHPERMLVADETGFNTNMEKGKSSRKRLARVTARGSDAVCPVATDDCHFTTLCFTNMLGQPIVVVIIIAQKEELSFSQILGADPTKPWIGETNAFNEDRASIPEDELRRNIGPGKRHPGGVTCHFNGKEIPPLVFHNRTGTMTSEILVKILQHLDGLEIFERKDGIPPPAVLLDGHGSRFGVDFLSYIRNEDTAGNKIDGVDHTWNGYIGLPNATHLWQVADAPECNGTFKEQLRIAAEDIVAEQRRFGECIKLRKTDIVPMVMKAFDQSFGRVDFNQSAIAQRGWNPPNRNCLLDHDLICNHTGNHRYDSEDELEKEVGYNLPRGRWKKQPQRLPLWQRPPRVPLEIAVDTADTSDVDRSIRLLQRQAESSRSESMIVDRPEDVHELNVSGEKPFDVIERLNQSKRRNKAQEDELLQRRKEQEMRRKEGRQQIRVMGRLTAGSEHKRGNLHLNDPETARRKREKVELAVKKARATTMERYLRVKKVFDMAEKTKQKTTTWNLSDYGWMIRYKELDREKIPGQRSVASTNRRERYARWDRVKDFPDPTPRPEPPGLAEYLEEKRLDEEAADAMLEQDFSHLQQVY